MLTAELLTEVYGYPIDVFEHPDRGELVVLPVREHAAATDAGRDGAPVVDPLEGAAQPPAGRPARPPARQPDPALISRPALTPLSQEDPVLRTLTRRPSATRHALTRTGVALLLASVGLVGLSTTASAEAQVTVADESGAAVSTVAAGGVVTVSGTGFQSVQGGAGGIYVVFGWVDDPEGGSWRPSEGGATGADYLYAPDTEDAQNAGFQRFVAFPGLARPSRPTVVRSPPTAPGPHP